MKNENLLEQKQPPTPVASSDLLGVGLSRNEQIVILDKARNAMRDLECKKRKEADSWHKQGALYEAKRCADQADAIDEAIRELLKAEKQYQDAKNATYA
jgi:hypothetical protein